MLFPCNNQNLVIVPSNIKGTGFLRTCYDKEYLKGIMPEDEFLEVVDMASKIVANVYTRKRLADTAGIHYKKSTILWLSVILVLVFLVLVYMAIS